jgi:hypothetical protein
MKDRDTILNDMVSTAADIMEAKVNYNLIVLEQIVEKRGQMDEVAQRIRIENKRIEDAINIMRKIGGCWA